MLDLFFTIASFLFLITVLVFVHELGHFLAARSVGIKVEKFYIGFNPFGLGIKKKVNGIEYGIGFLPLGGYVKVAGMIDENLDDNYKAKSDEYMSKGVLQKLWFTSAGVIFNFILSFLIFSFFWYLSGIPTNKVSSTVKGMPAANVGIVEGDSIISVNKIIAKGDSIIFQEIPIETYDDLSIAIQSNPNDNILLEWNHNGKILSKSVHTWIYSKKDSALYSPIQVDSLKIEVNNNEHIGMIGFSPSIKDLKIHEAILYGFNYTREGIAHTFTAYFKLLTGQETLKNLGAGGPVKIAQMAGKFSSEGIIPFLFLMASLSISLGVINIIPFPGLDGGHAIIAIVEYIIGRRIPFKTQILVQGIGMILLLLLMVVITTNDIMNIFAG